ncbi:MAG: hypothetical protein ACJARG_000022, partial [Arcticibacterium sp.]
LLRRRGYIKITSSSFVISRDKLKKWHLNKYVAEYYKKYLHELFKISNTPIPDRNYWL